MIAAAFCGCDDDREEIVYRDADIALAEGSGDEAALVREAVESPDPVQIRIHVCGAVCRPGVYCLPQDVRMVDAVEAAGGFTDDAGCDYLNLAAALSDGQKVYVPTRDEIESVIGAGAELYAAQVNITSNAPGVITTENVQNTQNDDGKVDINSADAQTLMTLPGIGASKADKIIAYREANGGFSCIEDLMLVGGIKEGLFNKVRDSICVR